MLKSIFAKLTFAQSKFNLAPATRPKATQPKSNLAPVTRLKATPAFTIIELMLSMTFVAVLLIAIAMITSHIIASYQKGLSIKSVNSVGRHLIDDISRNINSTPTKPAEVICREKFTDANSYGTETQTYHKCLEDYAYRLTFFQKYAKIKDKKDGSEFTAPAFGAFCTGRYSYIWNTGYYFSEHYEVLDQKPAVLEGYEPTNSPKTPRFLKVLDSRRHICASHLNTAGGADYQYKTPNTNSDGYPEYTLRGLNSNEFQADSDKAKELYQNELAAATDLLFETDESLAVYDFRIFHPAVHNLTKQALYSGTFILASTRGSVDITSIGNYCKEPSRNFSTDFAYCSLNKFNFAARALGKLRSDEQLERNIYENF